MVATTLKSYFSHHKIDLLAFLAIGLFLVINLMTLSHYGISWDEPAQQEIAKATITYIKTGDINTIKFPGSDQGYYGPFFGVVDYFSAKIIGKYFNLDHIASHHFLLIVFASLGLFILYLFAKKLFNNKVAIFSLFFLVLLPRFIGDSNYNTKDIPLAVFSSLALFLLFLTFKKEKHYLSVFAGIFFGASLAIRVDALLILPIFFISYLIYSFCIKTKIKDILTLKKMVLLGLFSLSSVATLFLTWPSLWASPLLFFHSILYFMRHGWIGNVLYLGKIYTGSNLPWHYAPVYLLITTPVFTLLFLLTGFFISFKKIINKDANIFGYVLIILWLSIPLLAQMRPGAVRYDGIRHFFIAIPALAIIAGVGFDHAVTKLKSQFSKRYKFFTPALLFVIVFVPLYEVIKIHPYEGYYFNEPLRYFIPRNIENYFDFEYWGTSLKEGVSWLNKNADPNAKVCVPIAQHLIKEYETRDDLTFECGGHYNYYMFFSRTSALPMYKINEMATIYKPVFKVSRFSSTLLTIYKVSN